MKTSYILETNQNSVYKDKFGSKPLALIESLTSILEYSELIF
jgi:hypothetical protein